MHRQGFAVLCGKPDFPPSTAHNLVLVKRSTKDGSENREVSVKSSPFHAENFSRKFSSQSGCRLSPKILIRNENSEAPSTGLFFGHFLKLQVKKTKIQEKTNKIQEFCPKY